MVANIGFIAATNCNLYDIREVIAQHRATSAAQICQILEDHRNIFKSLRAFEHAFPTAAQQASKSKADCSDVQWLSQSQ